MFQIQLTDGIVSIRSDSTLAVRIFIRIACLNLAEEYISPACSGLTDLRRELISHMMIYTYLLCIVQLLDILDTLSDEVSFSAPFRLKLATEHDLWF